MFILMHSNVDSSMGSVRAKWKEHPTAEQLTEALENYHKEDEVKEAVEELMQWEECGIDNCDSTNYEIQEI